MERFQQSLREKRNAIKRQLQLAMSALAFACLVLLPIGNALQAQESTSNPSIKATLTSFSQVPSVLAPSRGYFVATINSDTSLSFALAYGNMSSPVVQAHIHFGASRTNGGVVVFLCGGPKPACPASGTITGTITAQDVSVLPANNPDSVIPQGIAPGNLAGLFQAIRSGNTYINVHTANFPNGELRGQVEFGGQSRVQ